MGSDARGLLLTTPQARLTVNPLATGFVSASFPPRTYEVIQESLLSSGLFLFYQATPARKLGLNNPAMRDFGFKLRVKNVDFATEALPQILGLHCPVMPGQNRGQRRLGLDAGATPVRLAGLSWAPLPVRR